MVLLEQEKLPRLALVEADEAWIKWVAAGTLIGKKDGNEDDETWNEEWRVGNAVYGWLLLRRQIM